MPGMGNIFNSLIYTIFFKEVIIIHSFNYSSSFQLHNILNYPILVVVGLTTVIGFDLPLFRYWNDAACPLESSWVCKKPVNGEYTTHETTAFPEGTYHFAYPPYCESQFIKFCWVIVPETGLNLRADVTNFSLRLHRTGHRLELSA